MAARTRTIIRPFNGSLVDAEGLLDVERAVFEECPYSAKQVQAMLRQSDDTHASGSQRAWLAVAGDSHSGEKIVGFVIAFPTTGLQGTLWEIDLLAVLPEWRGQRLGTRLIRVASAAGVGVARMARAFVATDNAASARAFSRAGLRPAGQPVRETYTLLIYRPDGPGMDHDLQPGAWKRRSGIPAASRQPVPGVTVREATSMSDAAAWLSGPPLPGEDPGLMLLLAERGGQPAGYAELVHVQTLLYRGVWIESMHDPARTVREALVNGAVRLAMAVGLEEVGAMVPSHNWPLRDSLLANGFRSLGDFWRYTADLPLPGLAIESPLAV